MIITSIRYAISTKYHPSSKLLSNYQIGYNNFASIPKQKRLDKLAEIFRTRNSQQFFEKQIPSFQKYQQWQHNKITFQTYVTQAKKPKGLIISFHGLNHHMGHAGHFAKSMAQNGYTVVGYDYENFGRSAGKNRGLIKNRKELISTSEAFMKYARKKYSTNNNVFVHGLSLGGAVAIKLALNHLFKGVILYSPAIYHNQFHVPTSKSFMLLMHLLFPSFRTLSTPGVGSSFHSLKKFKEKDQFSYKGRAWTSTVGQSMILMRQIQTQIKQFSLPFLFVQAGVDKILNPFQCVTFYENAKSDDKTAIIIEDMWHSMYFDDRINDTIDLTIQWLNERV